MQGRTNTSYRNVQWAWYPFPIFVIAAAILLYGMAAGDAEAGWVWLSVGVLVLLLWVVITFSRLSVTVDDLTVVAAFGPGWPRKVIRLDEITSVETVRNPWWYGWGIRWLARGGWMYNVQGLDAVEIERRRQTPFRIGTAEADELAAAIRSAVGARGS